MSAPNLISPTTITAKTVGVDPANTNNTSAIANASSSGKAIKVNSIFVANTHSSASNVLFDVYVYKGNSTAYYIANNIVVPGGSTQVVSSKESYFYLEENDTLYVQSSIASSLNFVISYEEIS